MRPQKNMQMNKVEYNIAFNVANNSTPQRAHSINFQNDKTAFNRNQIRSSIAKASNILLITFRS